MLRQGLLWKRVMSPLLGLGGVPLRAILSATLFSSTPSLPRYTTPHPLTPTSTPTDAPTLRSCIILLLLCFCFCCILFPQLPYLSQVIKQNLTNGCL